VELIKVSTYSITQINACLLLTELLGLYLKHAWIYIFIHGMDFVTHMIGLLCASCSKNNQVKLDVLCSVGKIKFREGRKKQMNWNFDHVEKPTSIYNSQDAFVCIIDSPQPNMHHEFSIVI
jgi:hypothetical protein